MGTVTFQDGKRPFPLGDVLLGCAIRIVVLQVLTTFDNFLVIMSEKECLETSGYFEICLQNTCVVFTIYHLLTTVWKLCQKKEISKLLVIFKLYS